MHVSEKKTNLLLLHALKLAVMGVLHKLLLTLFFYLVAPISLLIMFSDHH